MTRRSFLRRVSAAVGAAVLPLGALLRVPGRPEVKTRLIPPRVDVSRIKHWTGAASPLWSDPRNWRDGAVPGVGDDVVVRGALQLSEDGPPLGNVTIMGSGVIDFPPIQFTKVTNSAREWNGCASLSGEKGDRT